MDLFKYFRNDNTELFDLQDKISNLENVIEKSLQSDYVFGVDGNNYVTYNFNNDDYYTSHYAVFRGINILSDNIAQLPLKLFRGETELPIDFVFPNGFCLYRPNTNMSLNQLLYESCAYLFFRGEFIQQIISNDGIFRLIPLDPKKLILSGNTWKYNNKIITSEEMIYSPFFNPNGIRGISPIDVVKNELANDAAAQNYSTQLFKKGSIPGSVLINKDGMATADDMERLGKQFDVKHGGHSKSYKTLLLPQGVEFQEISKTMREMEFLASRKDIRDKILIVLGIHKALVGITDAVNRSVAEEAGRQMWAQTLRPVAIRIQDKYNQQLFNVYFPGYHCKFDFSEVKELQDNMESVLKQAVEFKKLGYTTNEINEHFNLGMEPITDPEGDARYVPNYLKSLESMTAPKIVKEEVPKKAIDKIVDLLDVDDKTAATDRYNELYLKKRKPLEINFNKEMKSYFFAQRKEVLKIVNESKHNHNIINSLNKFFNTEDDRIKVKTKPLYIDGIKLGVGLANLQLKIVTGSVNKDIEEVHGIDEEIIYARLNKIVNVNHTVHNQIKMEMFESLRDSETINELSKRIKTVYNFTEKRCTTIARTELSAVVNESTNNEYKKSGVKRITWIGGTRASHARVNGSSVEFGKEFANGLKFPGDNTGSGSTAANLINCRCCHGVADKL